MRAMRVGYRACRGSIRSLLVTIRIEREKTCGTDYSESTFRLRCLEETMMKKSPDETQSGKN
jgi:hypothetical protein